MSKNPPTPPPVTVTVVPKSVSKPAPTPVLVPKSVRKPK